LKLIGFFNDFKLVDEAYTRGLLRNELKLRLPLDEEISRLLPLSDHDDCIAIHVRLGDYRKLKSVFGALTENYYSEALECLGFTSHTKVLIFSDEPNGVVNIMPRIANRKNSKIIRTINREPTQILFLMSRFKKIICANSSFSMWAAWYNSKVLDKRVVIPSPFMLDKEDRNVPSHWVRLPSKISGSRIVTL
jgi:hypothetical protein